MSTNYDVRDKKIVSFQRLRHDVGQGKIPGVTLVKEHQKKTTGQITDGTDYLIFAEGQPNVDFTRFGVNDVAGILNKIAKHYGIRIVSEHGDEEFPYDEELRKQKAEEEMRQAQQLSLWDEIRPGRPRKMEK